MVSRNIEAVIRKRFYKGKVIQLIGPRQVGKTTLLRSMVGEEALWLNADDADVRQMLTETTAAVLANIVGNYRIVVIDEAQRIQNIGVTLKLMVEALPEVQVIATGSSSFDLSNRINEPLTGRKYEFFLLPFSFSEMARHTNVLEERRLIEQRLIYGYYPEIVVDPSEAVTHLKLLASSYLYKDLFEWQQIKKPALMTGLLQALALQLGNEVSYRELAQLTRSDNETVERYVNLLEQAFVVFRLGSFSRNLRDELKRSRKIYFWDIGIRNAIINNFNPLSLRSDRGALWENFLIVERIKQDVVLERSLNRWFWRTHGQQEIDLIEEANGRIDAFEFKWSEKRTARFPTAFVNGYPGAGTHVIDRSNFTEFVLGK